MSTTANATALSILMPAYNAGRFLKPAVDSAVSQFADGDELVIQDGGSTDASIGELARAYVGDPRVKIVSERDGGQSDALQRALRRAVNPFIGWLNADDLYYPGALDAVRAALRASPGADVVYGGATIFAADDRIVRRVVPSPDFTVDSFVQHGCHVFSGATFLRADLVRDVGGFDQNLHYTMDFELFFRVAERARGPVRVSEVLGGLRYHDASKTGTVAFRFFREAIRVRLRYARTWRERAHVVAQMAWRLMGLPLLPIRNSAAFGRFLKVTVH